MQYTSFDGQKYERDAWTGEHVALLIPPETQVSPDKMNSVLEALDRGYEYYQSITGREPSDLPQTTLNGRTTLAVVDHTCGAGCGYLGWRGIEFLPDWFGSNLEGQFPWIRGLYDAMAENNTVTSILFYEFGRNFWFYGSQLGPQDYGFATGFAVANRYYAAHASGHDFDSQTDDETYHTQNLPQIIETFFADSTITLWNTLALGTGVINPSNSNGAGDFAAALLRLFHDTAGPEAYAQFWQSLPNAPVSANATNAFDNFTNTAGTVANFDFDFILKTGWSFQDGGQLDDQLTALAHAEDHYALLGFNGNDTIIGSDGAEVIIGDMGNDRLDGGSGVDQLAGGLGDDTLKGGAGDDRLIGGEGTDFAVLGGDRSDYAISHSGSTYTVKDNRVDAPDGSDAISLVEWFLFSDGKYSPDSPNPEPGSALLGTPGDDTLAVHEPWPDVVNGLAGSDTLVLVAEGAVQADFSNPGEPVTVNHMSYNSQLLPPMIVTNIEALNFRSGDVGFGEPHFFTHVIGTPGDDTLFGEYGINALEGGTGNDVLIGPFSVRHGSPGNVLLGGEGNDIVDNSSYGRAEGGPGDDTLGGLGGNDGTDAFSGGPGLDVFSVNVEISDSEGYRSTSPVDIITDFQPGADGDVIMLGGPLRLVQDGPDTRIDIFYTRQNPGYVFTADWEPKLLLKGVEVQELIAANLPQMEFGILSAMGTPGPDALGGDAFGNLLNGAAGSDTLSGLAGNDTLNGGAGSDSLIGEIDRDLLQGGADPDTLRGGLDDDTLNGGTESDNLAGDFGNDRLLGQAGNDTLWGDSGDFPDYYPATYPVTADSDTLLGGAGNDSIRGGAGSDLIRGGAGDDTLQGGPREIYAVGVDVFIYGAGDSGADLIEDFGIAYEYGAKLDLNGLGIYNGEMALAHIQDDTDGNAVFSLDGVSITLVGITKVGLGTMHLGDFVI